MSNQHRNKINKKRCKSANEDIMIKRSKNIISFVLICCTLVIGVGGYNMVLKYKNYNYVIKELEQQLKEEGKRTQEIKEFEEYTNTDNYVEQVAREKLGLIYPDEKIIVEAE